MFRRTSFKAQFDVTIIRPAGYHSLSSMPKISEDKVRKGLNNLLRVMYFREIPEGRFKDKFPRSVIMSTYLVAFIVSDFANISHLNHKVFARSDAIAKNKADFVVFGIKALEEMSKYIGVHYTLEKMDQVGIPRRLFFNGAMENWGLII